MKDENNTKTPENFPEKNKLLKGKNKLFQRLHIDKIVKGGTKKTTISLETLSYEFLSLKLGAVPHTKKANQVIKIWLIEEMKQGLQAGTYDPQAPYYFSIWLKQVILWELVDQKIASKWLDNLNN